ncbi:hypothetical protein, partial [Brucella melitensis]|uniref:hypothetical protein n=1 Tax=Brucella melitensis TaxID=29459 RepID=UPI0032BF72D3
FGKECSDSTSACRPLSSIKVWMRLSCLQFSGQFGFHAVRHFFLSAHINRQAANPVPFTGSAYTGLTDAPASREML